jgi:hypothetical protein
LADHRLAERWSWFLRELAPTRLPLGESGS